MTYKVTSWTASGWEISTDPGADPDKRWRAVHPEWGTRYFDQRHKILEYTVKYVMKQFERRMEEDPEFRAHVMKMKDQK